MMILTVALMMRMEMRRTNLRMRPVSKNVSTKQSVKCEMKLLIRNIFTKLGCWAPHVSIVTLLAQLVLQIVSGQNSCDLVLKS